MEAEECQPTYSLPPPQVHGAHQNRRHGSTKRIRVADCCEGRAARDPAPLGKYQKSSVGEAMADEIQRQIQHSYPYADYL
jgi:hypothetical protein